MTTRLRLTAGAAALAAGLWFLSAAAAGPDLPADTYKRAAEAEIAQLQKHLATIQADAKEARRYGPTAKAIAMILAAYGEATGDKALMDGALGVAGEIAKKNFAGADAAAKKLAVKGGGKALPPAGLHKMHKFELDEIMSPFRAGKTGGLNIEKDIRDMATGKVPFDPAAAEVLAARVTVLGDYAIHFPNEKAAGNAANKKKWEKWTADMVDESKKAAAEAAKGKAANAQAVMKSLKTIDAKCLGCHDDFRD